MLRWSLPSWAAQINENLIVIRRFAPAETMLFCPLEILHPLDPSRLCLNGQDLKSCSILINSSVYALACLWERKAEYHEVAKARPDEN